MAAARRVVRSLVNKLTNNPSPNPLKYSQNARLDWDAWTLVGVLLAQWLFSSKSEGVSAAGTFSIWF